MKNKEKIKEHFKENKKYYKIILSNMINGLSTSLAFMLMTCLIVKYLGLNKSVIDEHNEILSLTSILIMFMTIAINELYDISKLCKENKEKKENEKK